MELKKYKISLIFDKDAYLEGYLGSMMRGLFGESLKKHNVALFEQFFQNQVNKDNPAYKYTNQTAPPPFILNPLSRGRAFKKNDVLNLYFSLIGPYKQYEQEIIKVFEHLIPTQNQQINFKLQNFEIQKDQVFQTDTYIWKNYEHLTSQKGKYRMVFKTPLILKHNKKLIGDFGFERIFGYLYRRLFILNQIYGDQSITGQIPNQINTDKIENSFVYMKRIEIKRRPTRQNDYHISAWQGQLEYFGNFKHIYPYLKFGEQIHLGSNTAFGFGKYILI